MAGCALRSTGPATAAAASATAVRSLPPPRHTTSFGRRPPAFGCGAYGRQQAAAALSRRELLGSGAAAAALLPASSAVASHTGGSAAAAAAAAGAAAPAPVDAPVAAAGSVQLRELRTERDSNGVERLALQSEGEEGEGQQVHGCVSQSQASVNADRQPTQLAACCLQCWIPPGYLMSPLPCRLEQLDLAGPQHQLAVRCDEPAECRKIRRVALPSVHACPLTPQSNHPGSCDDAAFCPVAAAGDSGPVVLLIHGFGAS